MDQKETPSQIETAEELAEETSHLAEAKEDELRNEIITTYGFNPETDKERIEKAVQREISHKKAISKVVGQKVKYRNQVQSFKQTPQGGSAPKAPDQDISKLVAEQVANAIQSQMISSLPYSEEVRKEIREYAAFKKIDVQAAQDAPHIKMMIEKEAKQGAADSATISRNNKSRSTEPQDDLTPPDVDLKTEEGRKQYDKWKEGMKKKGY